MKGMLFKPEVWAAKQKALDKYGRAVTRRLDGLQKINEDPNRYKLSEPFIIASDGSFHWTDLSRVGAPASCGSSNVFCKPPFRAGQVIFVKEPWAAMSIFDNLKPKGLHDGTPIWYKDTDPDNPTGTGDDRGKWRSPMFMQCRFARAFLKVLSVRPERLQGITEDDAVLEGFEPHTRHIVAGIMVNPRMGQMRHISAFVQFRDTWDGLYPEMTMFLNPFVWRIELERVAK